MPSYAQGTNVPVSKTLGELQDLVERYGATGWGYGKDTASGLERIMFALAGRPIAFTVEIPKPGEAPRRQANQYKATSAQAWADGEHKRRWRCIFLMVKALLVAVEDGVVDKRTAFLPWTMLPDGATVGEWAAEQPQVWSQRLMPSLLPGARDALEA